MSHLANCLHYKPLKLKLKVFLSACTIAMVTYCAMKEAFFVQQCLSVCLMPLQEIALLVHQRTSG